MGRRALKKPKPDIDTAGRLFTIDDLPKPWDQKKLFGRSAPLEIEIGSGKGLFIRTAAEARPENNFFGIEISKKYAHFAAATLVKLGLTNAVMMAGDGLRVFAEFIPDNSVAAVHVYFPDPWWKKTASQTPRLARAVSKRRPADTYCRRAAPLLDRRGRVFSDYTETARRSDRPARPL